MKKTTKKKETSVKEVEPSVMETTHECVSKLEIDLGRGDLNMLRDKLNEVIEHCNGN